MAGIYFHIPYCKQKCHYCNFYSFASLRYRERFADALVAELKLRQEYLGGETVTTIYFGGGTPSLLTSGEINRILDETDRCFRLGPDVEITLEANPDDLDATYLTALKNDTPVNRLSIGVQSFFNADLEYLNRVHDEKQARASIESALKTGFDNLTIDLIYGIPTLTLEKWKQNLEIFFAYRLPHLSSYALTVEPRTALHQLIKKGKTEEVNEEESISHFQTLLASTHEQGYVHYEISNFAREGYYSRHNSLYWLGGHYLGIGPSAHSYNGSSRQWNVSNMKQYIEAAAVDQLVKEKETLTEQQRFNEYVMTSLRTSWGCDQEHIRNVFGSVYVDHLGEIMKGFIDSGKVFRAGNSFYLTDYGKLFADGIASALFVG